MSLRPVDLARAVNISTASVRLYEREGFVPTADRHPSGHRAYRQIHLDALITSRDVIKGYGWLYARRVMRHVHAGDLDEVLELVDARHAALNQERQDVRATVGMLEVLTRQQASDVTMSPQLSGQTGLRVGDAARSAGVSVPTLRFWETEGLVQPARSVSNSYRWYRHDDLVQLRVIATLRNAGYGIPHIREVIQELRRDNQSAALREVRQRLDKLTDESRDCLLATASLASFITHWTKQ